MKRIVFNSICLPKTVLFLVSVALLSIIGGYQLSQLLARVTDSSAQRSVQLLEIEESLDDAAIGLGRQIQEWKDMLLRANDAELYGRHQKGFKDASIGVQYALLNAQTAMQQIGMDTKEIDHLIAEHKILLAEYMTAYAKLKPSVAESSSMADKRVIGADRKLQQLLASVKSGISIYAKQQLSGMPETQGNRYLMMGLLGATSLFFMALFGFALGYSSRS